jgi:hypothetical protein
LETGLEVYNMLVGSMMERTTPAKVQDTEVELRGQGIQQL